MPREKEKPFMLMDLPDYTYPIGLACPCCYAPLLTGRGDGRCDKCRRDKKLFPVNYVRPPKKKRSEEDQEERKIGRRYNRDE